MLANLKHEVNFNNILQTVLHQYYFPKKLQNQTVSREKLSITIPFGKVHHKMLAKFTPVVNFINVLHAHFSYEILAPKPKRN